jgi:hypothetical protein
VRGDPFLARISTCSCTPDFCQRSLLLARIRRFNLLHSAAERMQSENSVALPYCPARAHALPLGLIAALRLHCTLRARSSASFASLSSHPIWSTSTVQNICLCAVSVLFVRRIRALGKVHVPDLDEITQCRTICLPSVEQRRMQRTGGESARSHCA